MERKKESEKNLGEIPIITGVGEVEGVRVVVREDPGEHRPLGEVVKRPPGEGVKVHQVVKVGNLVVLPHGHNVGLLEKRLDRGPDVQSKHGQGVHNIVALVQGPHHLCAGVHSFQQKAPLGGAREVEKDGLVVLQENFQRRIGQHVAALVNCGDVVNANQAEFLWL